MSFPWLTTIGVIPLIGAFVIMLLPKASTELAKRLAVVFSVIPLILVIAMALQFDADSTAEFQFVESHSWIRSFGISYSVGVDGISLVLIALSVILVPLVILAAWNDADDAMGSVKGYFGTAAADPRDVHGGVFAATDVFLFYVFFEAMLIPVYFLIGRYGGPDASTRQSSSCSSLVGGLLMLAALIGPVSSAPKNWEPERSTSRP